MRLITGDECGLLKECIPERSSNPKNKPRRDDDDEDATPVAPNNAMPHVSLDGFCRIDPKEVQSRRRGVIDMAFVHDDELSFAALRQNGSIQLWEGDSDSMKHFGKYHKRYETKNVFEKLVEEQPPNTTWKALALGAFTKESRLCAGDILGNLSIINLKNGSVVETYNAYKTSKGGSTISYTPGKNLNTQLATAMACDALQARIAMGGRERETTVLDLATGKVVFKAKNLPPDPQTLLQHPIWPTSILFLQDSSTMAVGTAYKELRLYDVRESSKTRRPIARASAEAGPIEYRVTSICQVNEFELAVGDAAGYIYSIDMRTLGKNNPTKASSNNMGRYVGPAGSVRQLKKHPTLPRMAAVGLDRMLRVYDTTNRKQLDCFYLKQRLNCVLFGRDADWGLGFSSLVEGGDEDDRDIDQDDVVQDYVDSDEDNENDESHSDDNSGGDVEEQQERDAEDQGAHSLDEEEESDSSSQDSEDDSEDESDGDGDDDEDAPNMDSRDRSGQEGSDDSDEEEIVIQAPKKRRRKR